MNFLSGILKKKKTALVLGGGSARGLAHIGILKIFQDEGIDFDLIVGTSIGAFIGAFFALEKDMSKAEKKTKEFNPKENLDIMIPPMMGLIKGEKIYSVIKDFVGDKTFKDTKIPMAVVCTDLEKGEEFVFTEGPLSQAIRLSCSYPGIFTPIRFENRLLVDGAILNNVPVNVARKLGAEIIVAVDVGYCSRVSGIKSVFGMILQAFQVMGEELGRYQVSQADIVINPDLGDINQLDFASSRFIIRQGEIAALEKLNKIREKTGIKKGSVKR